MALCARCRVPAIGSTMSRFNTDTLCLDCAEDEVDAPGYMAAAVRELAEVRAGNYNFPGVGLAAEDRAFLAERRRERKRLPTDP